MGWGFLKTIGKIGAGIAAPFTGGASLAAIPAIDAIGAGLGGASQASASNRGTKAKLMLDQNRDLEQQLLAREREKRDAQSQAYKGAMMGERASSWNPLARPAGVPGSYAGPTDASRGVGNELYNQALSRLQSPDLRNMNGMPAYNNLGQNKEFQKTLKPGLWEKISGIIGAGTSAYGGALSKGSPVMYGGAPDNENG